GETVSREAANSRKAEEASLRSLEDWRSFIVGGSEGLLDDFIEGLDLLLGKRVFAAFGQGGGEFGEGGGERLDAVGVLGAVGDAVELGGEVLGEIALAQRLG